MGDIPVFCDRIFRCSLLVVCVFETLCEFNLSMNLLLTMVGGCVAVWLCSRLLRKLLVAREKRSCSGVAFQSPSRRLFFSWARMIPKLRQSTIDYDL